MEIMVGTRVSTYLGAAIDHPVTSICSKRSQAGRNGDEESWEPPGGKRKKKGNVKMATIISTDTGLTSFLKYADVATEELTLNMTKCNPRKLHYKVRITQWPCQHH